MRDFELDNGGQGGHHPVMSNQPHNAGEPLKLDNDCLPSPEAVGEPRIRELAHAAGVDPEWFEGGLVVHNWRHTVPLYEGMAVGGFHIWSEPDGWTLNTSCERLGAFDRLDDAVAVMQSLAPRFSMLPYVSPPPPREFFASVCYFIGASDETIKIGSAMFPAARLKTLQVGTASKLTLLAMTEGGEATERAYHAKFADLRIRGEWFKAHPRILAEIERLNTTPTKDSSHG